MSRHKPNGTRWTYRHKAALLAAVECGALSLDDALRDNALSIEEFNAWKFLLKDEGKAGLMLKSIPFRRAIEALAQ